ncbi:hypothetical protein D3C79_856880 [compost metagenome]
MSLSASISLLNSLNLCQVLGLDIYVSNITFSIKVKLHISSLTIYPPNLDGTKLEAIVGSPWLAVNINLFLHKSIRTCCVKLSPTPIFLMHSEMAEPSINLKLLSLAHATIADNKYSLKSCI